MLYHSRQDGVREYQAQPFLAVELGVDVDIEQEQWIASALAFSSPSATISILPRREEGDLISISEYLERYLDQKPNALLYIGKKPDREEVSALRLLKVPYRAIDNLIEPPSVSEFPEDDPSRMRWREAFNRRYVLYVHVTKKDLVPKLLEAFLEVRRNFPDLILVLSGVDASAVPHRQFGLSMLKESGNLKLIQYNDILLLDDERFDPVIASVANVEIVTQTTQTRRTAMEAIQRSAAILFYSVNSKTMGPFNDLVNSGAIWSIGKNGPLGTTLTQMLSLTNSANASAQSLARLTETENELFKAIDELIGMERAA